MGRRLDAHLGRPRGGTGAVKRLHAGIEIKRYVCTSGLRGNWLMVHDCPSAVISACSHYDIISASHELIRLSDSSRYAFPTPPFQTDIRSQRSAFVRPELLRERSLWRDAGTRITADGANGTPNTRFQHLRTRLTINRFCAVS